MMFSELYSIYYNTVAKIISSAIEGDLTDKEMRRIIMENAYAESMLSIFPSLKEQRWQLIKDDLSTPIKHNPDMPLTNLQKSWLKAIMNDSRIRLFDISTDGLDTVDPLFLPEDYFIYDRSGDGDNYEDEGYIERFRFILNAVRNNIPLKIEMLSRYGESVNMSLMPEHLEYSVKDDKFRLIGSKGGCRTTVNLSRIISCEKTDYVDYKSCIPSEKYAKKVTLELKDERNALERIMLHFAHFEKEAAKLDDTHYRITLTYDKEDETEIVIRVLSFGPFVKVSEPESFKNLIKERLRRQKSCGL